MSSGSLYDSYTELRMYRTTDTRMVPIDPCLWIRKIFSKPHSTHIRDCFCNIIVKICERQEEKRLRDERVEMYFQTYKVILVLQVGASDVSYCTCKSGYQSFIKSTSPPPHIYSTRDQRRSLLRCFPDHCLVVVIVIICCCCCSTYLTKLFSQIITIIHQG